MSVIVQAAFVGAAAAFGALCVLFCAICCVSSLLLLHLRRHNSVRSLASLGIDWLSYGLVELATLASQRKSFHALHDCLVEGSCAVLTETLSNEHVQEAIGRAIVVGMNSFLRQPNLDEHVLLMSETVARTQPELARMSGEDFPKIVGSFFQGMLSSNKRSSNSNNNPTSAASVTSTTNNNTSSNSITNHTNPTSTTTISNGIRKPSRQGDNTSTSPPTIQPSASTSTSASEATIRSSAAASTTPYNVVNATNDGSAAHPLGENTRVICVSELQLSRPNSTSSLPTAAAGAPETHTTTIIEKKSDRIASTKAAATGVLPVSLFYTSSIFSSGLNSSSFFRTVSTTKAVTGVPLDPALKDDDEIYFPASETETVASWDDTTAMDRTSQNCLLLTSSSSSLPSSPFRSMSTCCKNHCDLSTEPDCCTRKTPTETKRCTTNKRNLNSTGCPSFLSHNQNSNNDDSDRTMNRFLFGIHSATK